MHPGNSCDRGIGYSRKLDAENIVLSFRKLAKVILLVVSLQTQIRAIKESNTNLQNSTQMFEHYYQKPNDAMFAGRRKRRQWGKEENIGADLYS